MKKIISFILLMVMPVLLLANDMHLSETFMGYAGNVPVKLKLLISGDKVQGQYAYVRNFHNTYLPQKNFIMGTKKADTISLNTDKGAMKDVSFTGKLQKTTSNGLEQYELVGSWNDPIKLIKNKVVLKPADLTTETAGRIINEYHYSESQQYHYSLNLSYPQFKGKNLNQAQKKINKTIQNYVTQVQKTFEKNAKQSNNPKVLEGMKRTVQSNTFQLSNSITAYKNNILSIRFQMFEMMLGAAHPNTTFKSMNFDLKTGDMLKLADMYKSNDNYLQTLSEAVRPKLVKFLYPDLRKVNVKNSDVEWIYDGTKPVEKNFSIWNIYENNLLLTFPAYQVAAYVYGARTVTLPLSQN